MKKITVVGSGQMGNGIAHVFAQAGYDVMLTDISQAALDKAVGTINKNFERQVSKSLLTETEMKAALARITTSADLQSACTVADLVVEAATENVALKMQIFRDLDKCCKPECILATNTSSISITKIAAVTGRSGKVIGIDRNAFYESCAGDEAGGSHQWLHDR
jgi:3-hydroxybutyryl-CoA dehydrogenase